MSFAYMPILWALSKTVFAGDVSLTQTPYNPDMPYNLELLSNRPYLYSSFLNILVTSVTAMLLFRFAVELGFSKRKAAAAALVFGIGSPAAAYAKYDYAQPLASLLLLCAFLCLAVARQRNTRRCLFLSGLSLGLLVLTRVEMLILAVPVFVLCVYLLGREASSKAAVSTQQWQRWLFFCLPVFLLVLAN
jgi:4-amino-4-deoxy-L-arabinose transferase-like glycosyltransferase